MNRIIYFCITLACFLCSSCNDYLNIAPKGNKIPTTLADFEALLRDQYTISRTPVENALYLLNDVYLTNAKVNTPSLSQANYMWLFQCNFSKDIHRRSRLPCFTQNDHTGQTEFKICPLLKWAHIIEYEKIIFMLIIC